MDNKIRVSIITQTLTGSEVEEQDYLTQIPIKDLRDFLKGDTCFLEITKNKNETTFINKNNVIYLNFDKREYEMLLRINDLEEVLSKVDVEKELENKINKKSAEGILKKLKVEYEEYKESL